jgi:hypothetical protein
MFCYSCVALSDSFSAVPRASGPVFKFCALRLDFGGAEGVASHFHVLCCRTCFRRYRCRRVSFSCFALPDSFSAVPGASGTVFMFCAPGQFFGGTEGVASRFHVLRAPDSFSAVPRAFGLVFMFCPPGLVFGGIEGVRSLIHVLRAQTRFRRYLGRWFPFSHFVRPDSFSAAPMASCTVLMFCTPRLIFGGAEGVGSRFHVLRARTHFRRYRSRRVQFCAPGLVFGGTEGVGSLIHVLRSRTRFRRYRELRVPFSRFALRTSFRRYRGRGVSYSCFALPD